MEDNFYESLLNEIEEGLIVIDMEGRIKTFNRRAKEITGVIFNHSKTHPGGRLQKGDLVIIADNRLGYDDGGLTAQDLKRLNIHSESIQTGDVVLAIGLYDDPSVKGIYKNWRNKAGNEILKLSVKFNQFLIDVKINLSKKEISISVDNEVYTMEYALAIGHMVVLDGKTKELKFYQAKGYTIRKETILNLLNGHEYLPKGDQTELYEVIGKDIGRVFECNELVTKVEVILNGENNYFLNEYFEINQRPTLCSLTPLKSKEDVVGILLKIIDVSNIENLIIERNNLIMDMEKTNKMIEKSHRYTNARASKSLIGHSSAMQKVKYLISRAASSRSTVLITGESGTGKTFVAREIHNLSFTDPNAPFISVNCTAIPFHLFESELFGYNKGAFTGAEKSGKKGFFELAQNGTLFLDEIGELPMEVQVKLLHVLQNKVFYKVGATIPTHVNVRVIAATNKDLVSEIQGKRFREDLYYRINCFPIVIPPLRDRKSDMYSLITSLMDKLATAFVGKRKYLSGEALEKIMQYHWPGNIRELENIIELAYNMADSDIIHEDYIAITTNQPSVKGLREFLNQAERDYIIKELHYWNHNMKKTIEALGISKSVFYEKIKKYNIESK